MKAKLFFAVVAGLSMVSSLRADEEQKVTFDDHIKPIFREHCASCHNQNDKESDLALDTYRATLAGGSSGEVIAEGNSGGSRLFALVSHAEQPHMPPDQPPIPEAQRDLLKRWIDQGMPENSGSTIKRKNNAAAAMLSTSSTGKPDGPAAMPTSVLRQPVTVTDRSAAIAALSASPWAPLVAVGGQNQVSLYNLESGELAGIIPFPEGEPQSLTFTRDGKQLLIGGGKHSHSGCAILVDVTTGERIAKVGDERDIVLAADISPDKSRIALGGPQKMVRIFNTATGDLITEMKKHTDWVYSIRYSPDGVLLASSDRANGLVVWEAETGRLYSDLVGHKGEIGSIDFRPDSNVLASASLDGNVKLWDMTESREIKSWAAHGGGATSIAFSQNGLIATAGKDARVKLWDGNGALQKEFAGLGEAALEVAVSGDGAQVVGGDWNGKVQSWLAADPNQTRELPANPPSIEKRLELASTMLTSVQTEFNTVKQQSDAATTQATEAQSQLAAAQQAATEMANKLAEATKNKETLTVQMTDADKKIAELEAQMALAKQQKEQLAAQMTVATTAVVQMSEQTKLANETMAAAQVKQQQLAQMAEAANAKRAEVEGKLNGVQTQVQKAQADKAMLDALAEKLKLQAQEMTTRAQQLTEQVAATMGEKQNQQQAVEKVTADLKTLQEQLANLQKQLEATANMQTAAQKQLQDQEAKANQLKTASDDAQAAALEAKEKLELFQKSYQK